MKNIRKILSQEDTVLFIGSGISMWSGLPSWGGLIEELSIYLENSGISSDLIKTEASRGDLLQAASYGFDKLTGQQIGEFIRTSCRYGSARPHEIHEAIVKLGPTCFITTNYDNLIEESIRKWLPDKFFRSPVTNRHLTETAEIVHARSSNFIFKPHGDAGDSESIIITREQYRELLPGGARQAALETVKMLLASRPVVYLGFGLRDPDFLYLRDLLANTYKGGTRDHYAIMADVETDELNYWRDNYGIHLINYKTKVDDSGQVDHGELLLLLKDLNSTCTVDVNEKKEEFSDKNVLSLARHAGRCSRFEKVTPELSIRVKLNDTSNDISSRYYLDSFDYRFIEFVLSDKGPKQAIITGLPGSGKTYSMKRAVAVLSERLNEVCMEDEFNSEDVLIPIYIDLKLYQGRIEELINKSLPSTLNFRELVSDFRVKLFVDSFNEMPREFLESGNYEKDISEFLELFSKSEVIFGSRTNDGLSKFEMPNYSLENIELSYVESALEENNIVISDRFKSEIVSIFQKPFFFNLFVNNKISLSNVYHPHDVYKSFFEDVSNLFYSRFNISFDLGVALSEIAFDSLNNGSEAQSLQVVIYTLRKQMQAQCVSGLTEKELVNWLVSENVFIPYVNNRVAFFHQSITEYLAAIELARRYRDRSEIIKEKLVYTRWDQALFLCLSLLPKEFSNTYFSEVMDMDFYLALSASKYVEFDRDAVIGKLLREIPRRVKKYGDYDHRLELEFEGSVLVSDTHESLLVDIMECKNSIGGLAAIKLSHIKGQSVKDTFFELLIKEKNDYNFLANGVMPALYPLVLQDDLDRIIEVVDIVNDESKYLSGVDECQGFIVAVSGLLKKFDLSDVMKKINCDSSYEFSTLKMDIVFELLRESATQEALSVASDFLLLDYRASISIYFIGRFRNNIDGVEVIYDWSIFNENHLEKLIDYTKIDEGIWSLGAIKIICSFNSNFSLLLKSRADREVGILKSILMSIGMGDSSFIYKEISRIVGLTSEQIAGEPLFLFKGVELDWLNKEELIVKCLKVDNSEFVCAIADSLEFSDAGLLDIGPVYFWLKLMADYNGEGRLVYSLSRVFGSKLSRSDFQVFIDEFNTPSSNFRDLLYEAILPARDDISTDCFTGEAISFLLDKLSNKKINSIYGEGLLANISTEKFVKEYLLPLSSIREEPMVENLREVLIESGARHGVRYISN